MNSFDMHQWRAKYFLKENKTVNTSTVTKKIATNEGGYDSTEEVGDEYEEAIYQVLLPKIKGLTPVEQEKAVMKVYDEMFDEMEPGTEPYSHVEDWLSKKEGKQGLKEQEELSSRVDRSSIEIGGIDRSDYPDFVDAYIFAAQFKDGTELTDDEMEQLNNEMYDEIHQMVYDQLFEGLTKREKVLKEQVLEALNESKKNTANQLRSIVKQVIKEETYSEKYESEAAKKVGRYITHIVDIFNKSRTEEMEELEQAIAKAEQETGTEVTPYEKRVLSQQINYLRRSAIAMES